MNTEEIQSGEHQRSESNGSAIEPGRSESQAGREALDREQDPIDFIKNMLESKSTAKQTTFKHLEAAFSLMCNDAKRIINELKSKAHPQDEDVTLYFKNVGKHEFHLKLAGDLLIFVMHTNIITFDDEHEVLKEQYTRENSVNRYFGQVNIYNFMYDSLRYNRGQDPGCHQRHAESRRPRNRPWFNQFDPE